MNSNTTRMPTRRGFLKASGLASILTVAALPTLWTSLHAAEPTTTTTQKPNIVIILVDDQGYGDLSCHGNPVLKTPHLDKLWAEGVRLTDFHVSSLCSPTRAALMTGRHCRKVGVQGTNGTDQHLATEAATMAEIFKANGYATGMFGKWHLGDRYPLRPQDRGFDETVTFLDGAVSTVPDFWGNDYFDDTYWHNGKPQAYQGYCTDVFIGEATKFIEANRDRPFFVYLPTNVAHGPNIAPEEDVKPYAGRPNGVTPPFYGMIAQLDRRLGQLREDLRKLGLERKTVFIFMTDNGTAFGARFEKGEGIASDVRLLAGYNAGMRGMKGSPYDGGHRVPCFIHYPAGGLTGGRDVNALAAHIDILPTLVELCGLNLPTPPPPFDGISLKEFLLGNASPPEDRVLIESFTRTVMTPRWRLVRNKELYDMPADRGQAQDVSAQHPDVVARLNGELEEYRKTEDGRPHRIVIGAAAENPVTLTGEDWKSGAPIYQHQIAPPRPHPKSGAVWNVDAARPGSYTFALRRWPRETGAAINAVLPKDRWVLGMNECVPTGAVEAYLRVGEIEKHVPVADALQAAEFTLDLNAGPATIEAWFANHQGERLSAPYVYVLRK